MIRHLLLAAAMAAAATLPAAAQSAVPVTVDSDGQAASCLVGRIARLDPQGDGFLAVRAGPTTGARKIDELHNGNSVYLCAKRGDWWGAVYGRGDCGVFAATSGPTPYRGPCRSGWIFGRYVDDSDAG